MSRRLAIFALAASLAAPTARAVSCSIGTPGGLAFGTYDPNSATDLIIPPGTCSISCSGKGNPVVTLSRGSSGTYFSRSMKQGAQTLLYNIYWDNTYAQIWGDGTGGTVAGPFSSPNNVIASYYGLIPARQDVPAGTYTDTVVLTVTF